MPTLTTLTTLRALFGHNDWARDRLMEAAVPLGEEKLDEAFKIGPCSLRATLQHVWRADRWWLDCWQGAGDRLGPPEPNLPLAELHDRFRATADERNEFLDGHDDTERFMYTADTGRVAILPLSDMVLHVCNHGFHHRAQALNMLRHLGGQTPDLDYLSLKMDPSPQPTASYELDVISEYFKYSDWASEQVLDAAEALNNAELDRPFEMGMGSLRKTLLHVRDAEQWWLENWSDEPAEDFEQLPDSTSIPRLRELAARTATRREKLFTTLGDNDLGRTVHARPGPLVELTFALGDTMVQLCGHGTHHRAQTLNMLRHLGTDLPGLDYADWAQEPLEKNCESTGSAVKRTPGR